MRENLSAVGGREAYYRKEERKRESARKERRKERERNREQERETKRPYNFTFGFGLLGALYCCVASVCGMNGPS